MKTPDQQIRSIGFEASMGLGSIFAGLGLLLHTAIIEVSKFAEQSVPSITTGLYLVPELEATTPSRLVGSALLLSVGSFACKDAARRHDISQLY